MGRAPSLSVITATYNLIEAGRRDSFQRALDCVRAQGGDGIEHVIQDGGSTDGTLDLIRGMTDGDAAVSVASAPDDGLYDGMNRAVERATGDYVIFLNSDDALADDGVLQEARAALAADPADFAFGGTAGPDARGEQKVSGRTNLRAVLQRMPFCHNSMLVRRAVFGSLGGHDLLFPVAADYDFVLRMVSSGYRGLDLRRPVSAYWTRGVSADDGAVATDYARVWKRYYEGYPAARNLEEDDFRRFYVRGHMPARLMLNVATGRATVPAIRRAALHSLGKSLRRKAQPWRKFE